MNQDDDLKHSVLALLAIGATAEAAFTVALLAYRFLKKRNFARRET